MTGWLQGFHHMLKQRKKLYRQGVVRQASFPYLFVVIVSSREHVPPSKLGLILCGVNCRIRRLSQKLVECHYDFLSRLYFVTSDCAAGMLTAHNTLFGTTSGGGEGEDAKRKRISLTFSNNTIFDISKRISLTFSNKQYQFRYFGIESRVDGAIPDVVL